jgi:uncharacterized membrane protein
MRHRILQLLLRLALLVAIVASTALLVDYSQGGSAFCGSRSGCEQVRASALSHIGPIGLPTIGLGVFLGLFVAVVAATRPAHAKVIAAMLVLSGVFALGLIVTQFVVLRAVCVWCMAVDLGAVVAAVAAVLATRSEPESERSGLKVAWLAAGVVAIAAPLSWAAAPAPAVDLPPELARLQQDGRVDVVMFTDFECPYCRRLHHALHARREQHPGRFHLARMMVPLPFHPGALPAAKAYVCTPAPAREAMAAKPDLGVRTIAEGLGLEREAFARCFDAKSTEESIAADVELYKRLELQGLPSTFVEDKLIVGANVEQFDLAVGGTDVRAMFATLAVVFGAVAAASLYFRPKPPTKRDKGVAPPVASAA